MCLPIITIITASIQPIEEFHRTAQSIEKQSVGSSLFEWIIVVGDYFDDYKNYVDSLECTENVSLYFQDPEGIYSAMNFGLEKAKGEWVWFINCGDYFFSSKALESVIENITKQEDAHLFASPVLYSTPQGYWFDVSKPSFIEVQDRVQANIHHQGAIVRTTTCRSLGGGFDVRMKFAADGKMLDSIASSYKYIILNKILVVFTMGGASSKNFRQTLLETKTYRQKVSTSKILLLKNWAREILVSEFAWKVIPKILVVLLKPRDRFLRSLYEIQD